MGTAYRHDFVSLDSDAANAATNVSADILPVVLESLAFGFYTMLVILTSLVILRSHDKLVSRKTILLVVCAAMYAAAATHIGITLALLFATNGQLDMALCAADMACTSCASDASACPASQILDPGVLARPGVLATMPTALLSLNMILGDLVVLWRALVLWPRRRAVQVVSTTLVAGTLGMLGWVVVGDYGLQNYYSGSIALLTSWITNVWSTALITAASAASRCTLAGRIAHQGRGSSPDFRRVRRFVLPTLDPADHNLRHPRHRRMFCNLPSARQPRSTRGRDVGCAAGAPHRHRDPGYIPDCSHPAPQAVGLLRPAHAVPQQHADAPAAAQAGRAAANGPPGAHVVR
ncbi:hypothetical protein PsYK624_033150 [Phanerochaete sordida]|uniref:Uncharacterized protein n=1 Tax=Phanerochaete sordida TaxID=48140 RepID=A0A9P3G1E0_9APHY|nr:hypothetical protein PsYK624_033150 [Phanerochaete sordida]